MNQPAISLLALLSGEMHLRLCAGLQAIVDLASARDPQTGVYRPVDPYALHYLASDLLRIACASRDRLAAAASRLEQHGETLAQIRAALPHAERIGASYLDAVPVHLLRDLLGE
ncbi:hypothetical protein D3C78_1472290 [compost metagenome]